MSTTDARHAGRVLEATALISTACTLLLTGVVLRGRTAPPNSGATRSNGVPRYEYVAGWRRYSQAGRSGGAETARDRVVVEFSDCECPFCAELAATLSQMEKEGAPPFRRVYRHYPLRSHRFARQAALAAECAAQHGALWQYHDSLFASGVALELPRLLRLAKAVGIRDSAGFHRCVVRQEHAARLRVDSIDAASLGITGTPLVLINGDIVRGAPERRTIDSLLRVIP